MFIGEFTGHKVPQAQEDECLKYKQHYDALKEGDGGGTIRWGDESPHGYH
ncbi:hypothetical protein TUM12370_03420 [Salmonella enterica subsp. enterica serovar Choleraesuis]|nr:hypothetical protein TUM12370_03420 [Salmonella enterica subsp. enterica serovar Choleraesuis]